MTFSNSFFGTKEQVKSALTAEERTDGIPPCVRDGAAKAIDAFQGDSVSVNISGHIDTVGGGNAHIGISVGAAQPVTENTAAVATTEG